jgi:transposase
MRTGRPNAALELTPIERTTLESLAPGSRTRTHLARRARPILLCGDDLVSNVVARKLHVRDQTVRKWRARFLRQRLDGLYDEPAGAPRTMDDAAGERVLIRTLETTPRGQTYWSLRGVAQATGLSRMTI